MDNYKNIFQQTADWQTERLGKFTASEIYKLMQKGRSKDAYFGETAKTYIKGRLAEIITQEPVVQLEGLAAIEWGNSNELDAVLMFERVHGLKVEYFGKANPRFFPYQKMPEWAGGSPDGLSADDAIVEVKCPYNAAHHVNHLLLSSVEEFKKEKDDYYGQVQFNMLCSGRRKAYFVSYDPRVLTYKHRLQVIEVPFDKAYCDELEERLAKAVALLNEFQACILGEEPAAPVSAPAGAAAPVTETTSSNESNLLFI